MTEGVERLLIWRMGSLGDTAVALPVFHMLAKRFAGAERRVLTNFPVNSDAAPIQAVLGDGGFVHGYFAYRIGTRSPARLLALRREVRAWRPDVAVYLNEPRLLGGLARDLLFLRSCGMRRVLAAPETRRLACHEGPDPNGLYESEARRLARCVAPVGDARIGDPASWRLGLTEAETAKADTLLAGWEGGRRFIAFSAGAKIAVKDWGDGGWRAVLAGLSADDPSLGLVLLGGANDRKRSDALAQAWSGPALNLCGLAAPRISAAVTARAILYMGNDSGPMHLAASVGTPSVAVFSTHARPGVWFPFGARHRIFYPGLSWSGGAPVQFRDAAGEANITQIPPAQVLDACRRTIGAAVS